MEYYLPLPAHIGSQRKLKNIFNYFDSVKSASITSSPSSLGGACWVVNRLDELDTPRYFTSRKELDKFKQGWFSE